LFSAVAANALRALNVPPDASVENVIMPLVPVMESI
jgi:hypothetical protein